MPQLAKGGKYVFGMSVVGRDGSFIIPSEAMHEYGYNEGDKVILMNGSRTSGGFVVTMKKIVEKSKISSIFETASGLMDYSLPEAEIVKNRGRSFCWTVIRPGGIIRLPAKTLAVYGTEYGGSLMVGRGSNFGIGFAARGPILELAMRHPAVETFGGC